MKRYELFKWVKELNIAVDNHDDEACNDILNIIYYSVPSYRRNWIIKHSERTGHYWVEIED